MDAPGQGSVATVGGTATKKRRTLMRAASDAHLQPVMDMETKLAITVHLWHDNLASKCSELHMTWIANLKKFHRLVNGKLSVCTIFSGSDITVIVLNTLIKYWAKMYGVHFEIIYAFSCESSPPKQEFLQSQFRPLLLFADAAELDKLMALDVVSNEKKLVPWVNVVIAGFPCVSRSAANVNAAANVGCVERGEGATGEGFQFILNYIDNCDPDMVVLENLKALTQPNEPEMFTSPMEKDKSAAPRGSAARKQRPSNGGGRTGGGVCEASDADYVLNALRSRNFWAKYVVFEARDHGSHLGRARCYFGGVKHLSPSPPGAADAALTQVLLATAIPASSASDVIITDPEQRAKLELCLPVRGEEPAETPTKGHYVE